VPEPASGGIADRTPLDGRILPAEDGRSIEAAIDALGLGELVGIPTDTVYGVAALANEEGVRRLIAAKERDAAKGIPLLIDALDQLTGVTSVPPAAQRLAERFWPGPLTLVLPLSETRTAPALLTGGRPTIGVRVPQHAVPRALARALGPLAVSSANLSGEPAARTAREVINALGDRVALVVDGGPSPGGVPSTVVEVLDEGRPTVLREGAIPTLEIESAAGQGADSG
jgi:L-threonylcarbamoyladenylate synthase